MIASGCCNNFLLLLCPQNRQAIQRASILERAGDLQILEFQEDVSTGGGGEPGTRAYGGLDDFSRQAFARLRSASQNRNLKLREVARRVIETGLEPEEA